MTEAEICRRVDQLKTDRANVENVWDNVERYVLPLGGGGNFLQTLDSENSKRWRTTDVWDSTAIIGAQRLASMVSSSMVSSYFRWFGSSFRSSMVNQNKDARVWLDEVVDAMYDALTTSNLGLEFAAGCNDMVGYGNTCVTQELVDPLKWKGLSFAGVPLREFFFEEKWDGLVYRAFRWYRWTPTQIISKFCPDLSLPEAERFKIVPEIVWKRAAAGVHDRMDVIFAVFPRENVSPMTLTERQRAPMLRPIGFKYVLKDGQILLGEEGGYYEMPAYVGRWDRSSGSMWGYGPGVLALPTVKYLNAWMETALNAAEKVVDPATLVTERGLLSDLDLGKGGLTTVRSLDDISTFESKARFDVSFESIEMMRQMVRKFFREDDLSLKDSPAMTATEAQLRVEQMNAKMGGTVERIRKDLLNPILQTTFNMMWREGQLPEPPDVVVNENPRMQIEFYGPFSRAQRSDEVGALERLASAVSAMKKMGFEEAADEFNAGQAVREIAERLSTPATVLHSKKEAEQKRAAREQAQAAMAQAEIQKTQAEGARAGADAQTKLKGVA